jgi:hypothetical protein
MKIGKRKEVPNQQVNFGKITMFKRTWEFKWLLLMFVFALEPLLTTKIY